MPGGGRTKSPNGQGRSVKKNERTTETYATKLQVINFYRDNGNNMSATLANFYPNLEGTSRDTKRKSIYSWLHLRETLEEHCRNPTDNRRKKRAVGTATTLPKEAEGRLVAWILRSKARGASITSLKLQQKALQIGKEFGVCGAHFAATWSWRASFLKRHANVLSRRQEPRISETYSVRLEVINYHRDEAKGDMTQTLAKFYPDLEGIQRETKRKNIYHWIKIREKLETHCANIVDGKKKKQRARGIATILSPEMEKIIVDWMLELQNQGVSITAGMLQDKALEVYRAAQTPNSRPFSATGCWRESFLKRNATVLNRKPSHHCGSNEILEQKQPLGIVTSELIGALDPIATSAS